MNDPGLEEPVSETQKRIEGDRKEEEDFEQEEEQTFLNPRSSFTTSSHLKLLADLFAADGGSLRQHSPCLLYVSDDNAYNVC